MTEKEISDLVIEANKAGFRGVRITGLVFSRGGADDPHPYWVTAPIPDQTASEDPWYN